MADEFTDSNTVFDSPVFVVRLEKGLADRQRLPLQHVISMLEEVRQMIGEAGREIQREMGFERPSGDFGLELVAGSRGILFRPGSVQAHIAITQDVQLGVLAAERVVNLVDRLGKKDLQEIDDPTEKQIVRRLNRIAKFQRTDKTELVMAVQKPSVQMVEQAIFGDAAIDKIRSLQTPVFEMEGLTVFGKLYELRDRDEEDEENDRGFWGELRRENSETWRIQFASSDTEKAVSLFRKQVAVTGLAKYYRIANPKLVVRDIVPDIERDYETAFDELFGSARETLGTDAQALLREMRGDD